MRNARFWIYHNGTYIKLTMVPDQVFTVSSGGPTEEGYSYDQTTYSYDGETVTSEHTSQSSDCDGRFDYHSRANCHVFYLMARENFEPYEPRLPEWQQCDSGQRDYAAEYAGY